MAMSDPSPEPVVFLAFANDRDDGTAIVWHVGGDALIALLDARVARYDPFLTPAEREEFGLE